MHHILYVNEATVFRLLLLCLLLRKVYILAVDPWFPPFRRLLQVIANWAVQSGRARELMDLCPELHHVKDRYSEVYLYDVFDKIESWQNDFFDFKNADRAGPGYALAYKNITTKFLSVRYLQILILARVLPTIQVQVVNVIGLPSAMLGALEAYTKENFSEKIKPTLPLFFPIMNLIIAAIIVIYSWIWILARLRPLGVVQKTFFFAADYIADPRDLPIYQELSDGGPVLLIARSLSHAPEKEESLNTYATCRLTDGRYTLWGALNALGFVTRDTARLCRRFMRQEPGVFFQLAALPYRRAVLRGLFTRYVPQFFWGRDDYNPEHIIRRQELNRIGSKSFGITHGFSTYCNRSPSFLYISFDQYYVFGKINYDLYKDSWAEDMAVTAVGSFGVTREDYAAIDMPRPNDIAVFTGIFTNNLKLVDFVRQLATAFPKRTVWLQVRKSYADLKRGKDFVESCTQGIPNIEYTTDTILQVFRRTRYSFSDPSTAVIEALQFGLASFMVDVSDIHETCILRDYSDLCLSTAEEAIKHIKNIEAGDWKYPRERYSDIIDLSGKIIFDVIRKDMSLPPKNGSATDKATATTAVTA